MNSLKPGAQLVVLAVGLLAVGVSAAVVTRWAFEPLRRRTAQQRPMDEQIAIARMEGEGGQSTLSEALL